jgi:hypothetical protein
MEISEAVKADYQQALYWKSLGTQKTLGGKLAIRLADALRDTLAEVLELEFRLKPNCSLAAHTFGSHEYTHDCPWLWDKPKWKAEADRLLRDTAHE